MLVSHERKLLRYRSWKPSVRNPDVLQMPWSVAGAAQVTNDAWFSPFETIAWYAQGRGEMAFAITKEGPGQTLTAWNVRGYGREKGPPAWMEQSWNRNRHVRGRAPRAGEDPNQEFLDTVTEQNTILPDSFMGHHVTVGVQVSVQSKPVTIWARLSTRPRPGT